MAQERLWVRAESNFIRVLPGDADQNVTALLAGKLYFNPDTMCSHHHEEGHNCGNHSCGEEKHGCAGNQ